MENLAEQWWLEYGQYYNPDDKLYPKQAIIDAWQAGYHVADRHLSGQSSKWEPASGYKGSIKHPQRVVEWDDTGAKTSRQ